MASAEQHTAGATEPIMTVAEALAEAGLAQVAALAAPGSWHPSAIRVEGLSAGRHVGGGWKITHHTTEGSSAAGAIGAYRGHTGWPHFTAEWTRGRLRVYQHLPLEVAGRALRNPPDRWETNRARTIQIEHVGFARSTGSWSLARYAAIGRLCRWIEQRTGCPRAATRGVSFSRPRRLSGQAFHQRSGHNGHNHVPGNDHTDPGRGFRIALVLGRVSRTHRTLRAGVEGPDVAAFQRAVNLRARACRRPDRVLRVDGVVGPRTLANGAWAAWILGVGRTQAEIRRGGIGAQVQRWVRDPASRNAVQKARAADRRRKHCGPRAMSSAETAASAKRAPGRARAIA
jgi:hypothetical protein